jgi:hypothetical protein
MSYLIKFIPEAEETFNELVIQLRQRWGDRFVLKFENRVLKCLETISQTPYIYPLAEDMLEIRKCLLHKNCSMLYTIGNDVIFIVCFWDNRQDPIITF